MKKNIYQSLAALVGAIIFGAIGWLKFAGYGGSECDVAGKSCDCFLCNMFGLRGYESSGEFGLRIGVVVGATLGLIAVRVIYRLVRSD